MIFRSKKTGHLYLEYTVQYVNHNSNFKLLWKHSLDIEALHITIINVRCYKFNIKVQAT